jgi:hypothetical protein
MFEVAFDRHKMIEFKYEERKEITRVFALFSDVYNSDFLGDLVVGVIYRLYRARYLRAHVLEYVRAHPACVLNFEKYFGCTQATMGAKLCAWKVCRMYRGRLVFAGDPTEYKQAYYVFCMEDLRVRKKIGKGDKEEECMHITREGACPVCMEEGIPVLETACGHTFCAPCVRAWCARAGTCPLCRQSMFV